MALADSAINKATEPIFTILLIDALAKYPELTHQEREQLLNNL